MSGLAKAITAYDTDVEHVFLARQAVAARLVSGGVSAAVSTALAKSWIHLGDFLLTGGVATFDAVIGNPPYVRIEQLAPVLQQEYRRRF